MYQSQQSSDTMQAYNPYSGHYPNQYPITSMPSTPAINTTASYFSSFSQTRMSPPPEHPPTPPEPTVSSDVAAKALQRVISSELLLVGYESAEQAAMHRFEMEVSAFVQQLFERAHEYANLANRAGAIASDVILACEDMSLSQKELQTVWRRSKKGRQRSEFTQKRPTLVPPPSRSPSPELLASDDEDATTMIPSTLRGLPSYLPSLPPKHTYLQTPASPPKKAALPSLEKKLKTAGLVQESLQNLLLATEDNSNQEDGELLGHIVNWEMGIHPRKRWRITR